jgi:uncharacterized membrane-anchored protein
MKNTARWILFGVAIAAQLAVPVSMIVGSEDILASGVRYHFRTRPVDPEDAFRGKYVALGFEETSCAVDTMLRFKTHQKAYALIARDDSGFAQVTGLTPRRPAHGDYVKVVVTSFRRGWVDFRYPFEKYFLEEENAPRAEGLYREHNLGGNQDTYVVVRVKNGAAVIEDLVIGGLPVREALRQDAAKTGAE